MSNFLYSLIPFSLGVLLLALGVKLAQDSDIKLYICAIMIAVGCIFIRASGQSYEKWNHEYPAEDSDE